MELLKNDKQWFLSDEGSKKFATLFSVEERAIFIYSYFKTFANEALEKENILFKTAFLLADSVVNSNVEYSDYPKLLDERINPFVAFLSNAKREYTEEQIYCIFLAFIHNIADPFKQIEWIYNDSIMKEYGYIDKIYELGHMFVVPNPDYFVNIADYECGEEHKLIQLEIIWLFGKK